MAKKNQPLPSREELEKLLLLVAAQEESAREAEEAEAAAQQVKLERIRHEAMVASLKQVALSDTMGRIEARQARGQTAERVEDLPHDSMKPGNRTLDLIATKRTTMGYGETKRRILGRRKRLKEEGK